MTDQEVEDAVLMWAYLRMQESNVPKRDAGRCRAHNEEVRDVLYPMFLKHNEMLQVQARLERENLMSNGELTLKGLRICCERELPTRLALMGAWKNDE